MARDHSTRQALPCHLFRAAFWAISRRRFAESATARALPPFRPPSRPNATAAGFFLRRLSFSVCRMTWRRMARAISSRRGRFELDRFRHGRPRIAQSAANFPEPFLGRLLSRNAGFHAPGASRRLRAGCAGRSLRPREKAGKLVRQFFHALEAGEQVGFRQCIAEGV
jgi:hypothetical protein